MARKAAPNNNPNEAGGVVGDLLRSFIERIERLEEEKKTLAADIKEVFAEAKGNGFDTKIMRQLIRIRRMDKDDLDEQETLLDVYKRALGDAGRYAARRGRFERGCRMKRGAAPPGVARPLGLRPGVCEQRRARGRVRQSADATGDARILPGVK